MDKSKRERGFRRSITWRLTGMMLLFVCLFFVGVGVMNGLEHSELDRFQRQTDELARKQRLVSEITRHMNGIFYRSRGYFVNLNESEYNQIFTEKEDFENAIGEFDKLRLKPDEEQWIRTIEAFFRTYFDSTLPEALELSRTKDYDALRRLTGQGLDQSANGLIQSALKVQQSNQAELDLAQSHLDERLSGQGFRFLLYALGLLLVSCVVLYKTARDISVPIARLSGSANRFALGIPEPVEYTDRQDEIGGLARSLETMMLQIQSKGQELIAQNEELLAQQDELQMQQEELSGALAKMESSERYLRKRNLLILALAVAMDRQELLRSIIRSMVDLLQAEKGIVVLLDEAKDHAAYGLSDASARRFLAACEDGLLARVRESKKPYTLLRQATEGEQGYHSGEIRASDLYIPVPGPNEETAALLVLSRTGRPFDSHEEEEAAAFAIQISLSLEKLSLYETAEDQRQLTQNMLDTIQEGIQLLDREGTTIQVNSKWFELMGIEPSSEFRLDLAAFHEALKPLVKDPEPVVEFIDKLVREQSDEEASIVYEMSLPEHRFVHMYSEPLYRGSERLGALLVQRDITKEYESDRLKSEFVSTVSHELRTPLASVLGFAELLLHKSLAPERQKKYIQTIHQEATRLTALINDFLDLQRMESGKQAYDFRPVPVAELAAGVLELHQANAAKHRFVFADRTDGAKARADADKIRQVLMNVIGNAIKYSPGGGTVTVSCYRDGDRLAIEVADDGLGIPREALPKLFGKFYRVDNTDRREIGGTGLGLAIVKEIMQIHGGDVLVESEYGKGSTFTLLLPVDGGERPRAASTPLAAGRSRVFIVEDDASLSELLTDELVGSGYEAESFVRGEDALAAMEREVPDALVLDLILGNGMGGLEVIERMKRDERLRSVPILVSSAFEEKARAMELGAKGYLVKPYQPNRLTEALAEVLGSGSGGSFRQVVHPTAGTHSSQAEEHSE